MGRYLGPTFQNLPFYLHFLADGHLWNSSIDDSGCKLWNWYHINRKYVFAEELIRDKRAKNASLNGTFCLFDLVFLFSILIFTLLSFNYQLARTEEINLIKPCESLYIHGFAGHHCYCVALYSSQWFHGPAFTIKKQECLNADLQINFFPVSVVS